MKIKKLVPLVTATMVLFSSFSITASAKPVKINDYTISDESIDFLKMHNVDITPFKRSHSKDINISKMDGSNLNISPSDLYDESILSFKQQVEAYNFSDEQIQQYIDGMVSNPPTIVDTSKSATTDFAVSPAAVNPPPYADNRVADKGIGYEVKSLPGYYQQTAFATVPSAYRTDGTSAYLLYTVSQNNVGIDLGIWYSYGASGTGWRACYYVNDGVIKEQKAMTDILSQLTPGKEIYLIATVRNDGYVEFKVLDSKNFSIVYANFVYYMGNKITQSGATINRQITLTQQDKNFTNGSYMRNAKFDMAYLYKISGTNEPVSASNTVSNRRGVFGTNNTDRLKVTLNSYTPWGSENVSINFQ